MHNFFSIFHVDYEFQVKKNIFPVVNGFEGWTMGATQPIVENSTKYLCNYVHVF